jgi:HEAT repeat protein
VLDLPPYKKAAQAIDAGAQYLMQIGDAWFNQIPREGNIYTRAASLHDTATRCTACHPAAFPTEATLAAVKAGYHLRARRSYDYVIERIYNSPAPLYGGEAYFQRFIAIPLQAQGKQGGILLDHERLVSGRPTRTVERFAPFLAAAWSERTELPADEQNGVIPADSKFGIAWRDWRVLHELGDRAGNPAWQRASDRIRDLLLDSAANKKVETFQDRIHRVRAWSLLDSLGQKPRIQAEIDDFWRLQNEDGGWHEIDSKKGPSAVYTTGQLVWTLAEVGVPADAPGMQRAIEFLLKEQQPFGGWIQTTTHENFRTPMRETRFAVMALASTHPRPAAPPPPLAQGDAQPKASLRTGEGDIALLDDLEALWDLPEPERSARELAVIGLLEHPEPTVRAAAAAALGRIGGPPSVPPLLEKLADSAKPVWRAAAWALRRLGNKGIGVDAIRLALSADNPRIRRGAARVFAYQFHGMDERPEIAMRLIELSQDPDLWTRLQAIKTLRHWFYRTSDDTQKRRIVYAHLAGLDRDEHPVIRRNWIEGLYIIMDENLGGGVSLQKNLAQLPEPARARALAHRSSLEDRVLLQPILAAIASGSARQREGILRAFDGSFFAGRFYARRPTGMIDVGNDREFGFLHDPGTPALERAFVPLFQSDLSPPAYLDALKLAAFFDLPARATSPVLVSALRPEALRNAGVVITSAPPAGPPVDPPANSPAEPRSIGRLPSFEAFRVHINPIFYKPSADGVSCAKCHGTHEILRLAPPPAQGDFSDDDVRQNYASTLKVIDRANPEKSLVLRKPLSPHGQGEPDPSSPTGITHVGGPRWEDPDPPDYRALLRWIRGESPVANDSPQPASDKPR